MSKIYTISILLIIIEIPTVKANMRFFFLSVYYSTLATTLMGFYWNRVALPSLDAMVSEIDLFNFFN
jgi:hypothetical protein